MAPSESSSPKGKTREKGSRFDFGKKGRYVDGGAYIRSLKTYSFAERPASKCRILEFATNMDSSRWITSSHLQKRCFDRMAPTRMSIPPYRVRKRWTLDRVRRVNYCSLPGPAIVRRTPLLTIDASRHHPRSNRGPYGAQACERADGASASAFAHQDVPSVSGAQKRLDRTSILPRPWRYHRNPWTISCTPHGEQTARFLN